MILKMTISKYDYMQMGWQKPFHICLACLYRLQYIGVLIVTAVIVRYDMDVQNSLFSLLFIKSSTFICSSVLFYTHTHTIVRLFLRLLLYCRLNQSQKRNVLFADDLNVFRHFICST